VTQYFLAACICCFCFVFSIFGCISSEETGAGNRARSPVQIFGPVDTLHHEGRQSLEQDSLLNAKNKSKFIAGKSLRVAPKFKSKQDTVQASVITKLKSHATVRIKIERPEHPIYTVQIGAFRQASNALRIQKKAKQRFTHQPVFNRFVKSAQVYRVSIGRYKDRKNAFSLADTMKQKYPKEYERCWINFIP
jgi:cell division septation protein DedD